MPTDQELYQAVADTIEVLVSLWKKDYPATSWKDCPEALKYFETAAHEKCRAQPELLANIKDYFQRQGISSMDTLRRSSHRLIFHHLHDVLATIQWQETDVDQRPASLNYSLDQVFELVGYVFLSDTDKLLACWQ